MLTSIFLTGVVLAHGVAGQQRIDEDSFSKRYFGNDAPWYKDRIPYFECSDGSIQDVYYYRWKIFRAHQRDLGELGYISTEFLNDVGWQLEPWASLNDATGFHIGEGRWLRDRRFVNDQIRFMHTGHNDRHFTDWISSSVWGRYLVDGDADRAIENLGAMIDLYNQWDDAFDSSKGLYWREPLADATEYTISSIDASGGQDGFGGGQAFRPSINSYMWSNALAIVNIAKLNGQGDVAAQFQTKADTLKKTFQDNIWNSSLNHFFDRYYVDNQYVKYWQPIRGRELVGYVPWAFSMPDNTDSFNSAWEHITREDRFKGVNGFRTNEPSYEYYMRQYRYDGATGRRECQWNGPTWPYQETQLLLGMANLLHDYTQSRIDTATYMASLRSYTKLHYDPQSGILDLQEDYEPDKAGVIVGLDRSHHYFHSGYNDLIISGMVGLKPQADDTVVVSPLVDSSIGYFALQGVKYHGRSLTITWDADGSRYGRGQGLTVEVDGNVASQANGLQPVTVNVGKGTLSATSGRIAQSIQLVRGQFPSGSVTSGNDAEAVHAAIDGRVIFFPEAVRGWSSESTSDDSRQSFTIDFGKTVSVSSAELALYTDDNNFALPKDYDILAWNGQSWDKIYGFGEQLLANGITNVNWNQRDLSRIRFEFTQPAGKKTMLVEFKVF